MAFPVLVALFAVALQHAKRLSHPVRGKRRGTSIDRRALAGRVQFPFRYRNLASPPGLQFKGDEMTLGPLMVAATIAAGVSGTAEMVASPAHAQGAIEAEIVGF